MLTVPRSFADLRNLHPNPISPSTLTRDKSFPPRSLCPEAGPQPGCPLLLPPSAHVPAAHQGLLRSVDCPSLVAPPLPWFSSRHLLLQGTFSICLLVQPRGMVQTPHPSSFWNRGQSRRAAGPSC